MRKAAIVAMLLLTMGLAAGLVYTADAHSDGSNIFAREGCTCHSQDPSTLVSVSLSGLPERYQGGSRYPVEIQIAGAPPALPIALNQGGFAIEASGGRFEPQTGAGDVQASATLASHTDQGNDQRAWRLEWIAPDDGAEVTFTVAANAVDGNGQSDPLDLWQRAEARIPGAPKPAPPPVVNETVPENQSGQPPPAPQRTPLPALAAVAAGLVAARRLRRHP